MSFPPESYLIGAQKAGTTTLAYLLDQHPRLTIGQTKEPHFFTDHWRKGLDWYRKQYPDASTMLCLDASTSYAMAPLTEGWQQRDPRVYEGIPARVHAARPDAKFIYLVTGPGGPDLFGVLARCADGCQERSVPGLPCSAIPSISMSATTTDSSSGGWSTFPLSSFHFVLFERMKEHPHEVVNDCLTFLGLPAADSITMDSAQNQSYQVGWVGRQVNRIEIAFPGLRSALKSALPGGIKTLVHRVKAGSGRLPAMSEEDRRFLVEYFRERNQQLERLIGLSLDGWRR